MAEYAYSRILKGSFTGTAAAVGTIPMLEGFKAVGFQISGLTTETIGATLSLDGGTTFSAAIKPQDAVAGATAAAATLGNGTYFLPIGLTADSLKFTKSAGAETVLITYIVRF